jgi:hypothetical protein
VEESRLGLLNYCLGGRDKRRADLLQGLLHLACALVCLNVVRPLGGSLEIYDQCGVEGSSRRVPPSLE